MEYREMMRQNDENLGWCKPLSWNDGAVVLAVNEGTICGIQIGEETVEVNPVNIKAAAKAINRSYDDYEGWTDTHIALDCEGEAEELPCRLCPWFGVCDAMGEEIEEAPEYTED